MLVITCVVVAVLAVLLCVLSWDWANKVAASVSALASVAAVGIAVWTVLARESGTRVRIHNSGDATATRGGKASTGVRGPADAMGEAVVEDSGNAKASDAGEASTGVNLT
ncbi:hypothetical protein ABT299_42480 [Spirillospora sp. NPDC000708]